MKSRQINLRAFETAFTLAALLFLGLWFRGGPSPPPVTVSGLELGMSAESVRELLGPPDFRSGHPTPWAYQYWNREPADSHLTVEFDSAGEVWRIEGGLLEISGEPLPLLHPEGLVARLGRPLRSDPGLHAAYILKGDARLIIVELKKGSARPLLYRAGGR